MTRTVATGALSGMSLSADSFTAARSHFHALRFVEQLNALTTLRLGTANAGNAYCREYRFQNAGT